MPVALCHANVCVTGPPTLYCSTFLSVLCAVHMTRRLRLPGSQPAVPAAAVGSSPCWQQPLCFTVNGPLCNSTKAQPVVHNVTLLSALYDSVLQTNNIQLSPASQWQHSTPFTDQQALLASGRRLQPLLACHTFLWLTKTA